MGSTNGFFYTPWYSQGVNDGYSFQGPVPSSGFGSVAIYPNPQNGYTSAPSTGLVPLYQWWVVQGFRSYTQLTTFLGSNGSGYTPSAAFMGTCTRSARRSIPSVVPPGKFQRGIASTTAIGME
jgi:hypothetical protein